MARVLFILKFRDYDYCGGSSYGDGLSSGLYNSARFVVEMLNSSPGVVARLVQVRDNNDIDREVTAYRPTHAIIEGLWVVPEKFNVLIPLHPTVQWIVRIHSEIPFLAMEGVAMDWIARYSMIGQKLKIACNSARCYRDIKTYIHDLRESVLDETQPPYRMIPCFDSVLLLPNYYPRRRPWWRMHGSQDLKIGCFGAIRPLKNQLIQALAAIAFADRIGKKLRFYMTSRDCEQGGEQVLKNLRALFAHTGHELVLRPWLPHDEFLGLVDRMDLGMQVSLSESFNIVAADMVSAGLPVVVSPEVAWTSRLAQVSPVETSSIIQGMARAMDPLLGPFISWENRRGLEKFSRASRRLWLEYLEK